MNIKIILIILITVAFNLKKIVVSWKKWEWRIEVNKNKFHNDVNIMNNNESTQALKLHVNIVNKHNKKKKNFSDFWTKVI